MKQLSTLDATFYYLESHRTPMHVGGVYVFENPAPDKKFDFQNLKQYIGSRLLKFPVFRQRLVEVPLDLGHPYWFDDPDFELEFHISHVALPQPADTVELLQLASRFFSRPLDRQRALWEVLVVEGLQLDQETNNAFAIISKVHHAAIDGKSGVAIMELLFNSHADQEVILHLPPHKADRIPTNIELLIRNSGEAISTPFKVAQLIGKTIESLFKNNADKKIAAVQGKAPPAPFTAPRTLFNVPVTPHRIVAGVELELNRIKNIKNKVPGTTVNDVILAVCSGALRHYLLEKNDLPQKSLIAMAPVSIRDERNENAIGNHISAMLVSLSTDIASPLQRLKAINKSTVGSKVHQKAVKAEKLMDYIPSQLDALAARLYTRMKIGELHKPVFNLVITNVPGPSRHMYMNGSRMLKNLAIAPLIDGLGLIITVFSYAGNVSIGLTSCREIMPDIKHFAGMFLTSLSELENEVAEQNHVIPDVKSGQPN
ncbi:MAG: wax ester/triacylglycerol synthase family O-acyltransferase [Sphingobacteriales bacterium]|nr:MAG: wax ester/triacylglycerol synthase family O-acyltransferase [Sphingobacteriales bacterium]